MFQRIEHEDNGPGRMSDAKEYVRDHEKQMDFMYGPFIIVSGRFKEGMVVVLSADNQQRCPADPRSVTGRLRSGRYLINWEWSIIGLKHCFPILCNR